MKALIFLNSIPNDKILDCSKLKAFAGEKINVNHKVKFLLGRIETIVGKGENTRYQHFLFCPLCFLPYLREKSKFEVILFVVCKCFQFGLFQSFFLFGKEVKGTQTILSVNNL